MVEEVNNNSASSHFSSITVSPPLSEEKFPPKNPSIDSNSSATSSVSTASKNSSTSTDQAYQSDVSNRSKSSSTSSNSTNTNTRPQRSRSIQQNDSAIPGRGRQYINIPNTSHQHNGRSPLRSSQDNTAKLNATRAGAAAAGSSSQSSLYNQSQRRGSIASVSDSIDFSTSSGNPYTLTGNSSSVSTLNNHGTRGSIGHSSASSPKNSFSSNFSSGGPLSDNSSGSLSQRRYSDNSYRRPSTEEVFDQMEREQDSIVLRLTKEIQYLKEENRSLRQTINQLSANSGRSSSRSQSRSQSRSSIDSRRRRNSTVFPDDDLMSVSSNSISNTPRSSNYSSLPQSNTSSRKPSINFIAGGSTNSYDASKYPSLTGPHYESLRSNTSTINIPNGSDVEDQE
ncbi:EF-hand calcium-binding domain-containing protein [Wickerhamomyces ciferrii]|uniref:EF-hand calcium-binding domain-containing protein n=1 Tax=Wickerhamomyces ciferrii (strain ATCC 14091 / BCRC 22168 / CBS 111 / JCM 3599 / NBRC 0793 / NRRL Y-1031 F-60-10) TaxID=1206466 RepID=K0KTR4_WICCF|nr:EF-hand calcium-binding domain-containing protein [Wickerhamomyces ciferrii]CCH46571.1 EF-hand calcium-binding domain-containing protein [Wickerhamomyces ciferrii]